MASAQRAKQVWMAMTAGISAIGTYLPRLRLSRKSMAAAMSWLTPQNHAPGSRTLAFWDEDSVTMAVAAARSCLAGAGNEARRTG